MTKKITFAQLVEDLSDEQFISKTQSQEFINALVDSLLDDIQTSGKATITNFGSFKIVRVAARTGINPKTGEQLVIPEHDRISFTPYKALESAVNRDFEHLEAKVVGDGTISENAPAKESSPQAINAEIEQAAPETIAEDTENFDDPFNIDNETDDEDSENELNLDGLDEQNEHDIEEADNNLNEDDDEATDTQKTSVPFRAPGRPQKSKTGVSPAIILGVFAILIVSVLAIWFLFLRDTEPQTAMSAPSQAPSENTDAIAQESSDDHAINSDENAPPEEDSRLIPMMVDESLAVINQMEVTTVSPQQQPANVTITYVVSSGVWIYEIARQTYGNTRLWPLIFQANYTLDNNPDMILPNITLNIPRLEGTTDAPSGSDYIRLAEAARYVAEAYEFAGNEAQAEAYRKAADWYQRMANN